MLAITNCFSEVVEFMNTKIGCIIREIRISKKIKSNVLYKEVLSRPSIIKFEEGESDTTVERFLILLDRLNITLEEFVAIYKNGENQDLSLTSSYIQAFYKKDLAKLNDIYYSTQQLYKSTKNQKYLHYGAIISLLIDSIQNNFSHKNEKDILQDYLMRCETWGYYELTLFINTLNFYSNELIDTVYRNAKKNLLKYNQLPRYRNEFSILLFNILEKKLSSGYYRNLEKYLDELTDFKNQNKDVMYYQSMVTYFENLINIIKNNNIEDNVKSIENIISIFKFLKMDYKAEQCQTLLTSTLKRKKDPKVISLNLNNS